jgi:hypothetical protein
MIKCLIDPTWRRQLQGAMATFIAKARTADGSLLFSRTKEYLKVPHLHHPA